MTMYLTKNYVFPTLVVLLNLVSAFLPTYKELEAMLVTVIFSEPPLQHADET